MAYLVNTETIEQWRVSANSIIDDIDLKIKASNNLSELDSASTRTVLGVNSKASDDTIKLSKSGGSLTNFLLLNAGGGLVAKSSAGLVALSINKNDVSTSLSISPVISNATTHTILGDVNISDNLTNYLSVVADSINMDKLTINDNILKVDGQLTTNGTVVDASGGTVVNEGNIINLNDEFTGVNREVSTISFYIGTGENIQIKANTDGLWYLNDGSLESSILTNPEGALNFIKSIQANEIADVANASGVYNLTFNSSDSTIRKYTLTGATTFDLSLSSEINTSDKFVLIIEDGFTNSVSFVNSNKMTIVGDGRMAKGTNIVVIYKSQVTNTTMMYVLNNDNYGIFTHVSENIDPLTPITAGEFQGTGASVAISDAGFMVVGSTGVRISNASKGQVYIVPMNDTLIATETIDPVGNYYNVGDEVAVNSSGNVIALTATDIATGKNDVLIYNKLGGIWVLGQTITSGGSLFQSFGSGLALSDDGSVLAIGDKGTNGSDGSVEIYTFQQNAYAYSTSISQLTGIVAPNFGWSVSMNSDGSKIVVGQRETSSGTGGVYTYEKSGAGYTSISQSVNSLETLLTDSFSSAVALSNDGNLLVVGAANSSLIASNNGWILIYDWNNVYRRWDFRNYIFPPTTIVNNRYGYSVALSQDNTIAVGAKGGVDSSLIANGKIHILKDLN